MKKLNEREIKNVLEKKLTSDEIKKLGYKISGQTLQNLKLSISDLKSVMDEDDVIKFVMHIINTMK